MVIGAKEKRSYAMGAGLMVGVPALAALACAFAPIEGLGWIVYALLGLAVLGGVYWYREGLLLSLTIFPDGLRISQLGGSDYLYYSIIQGVRRVGVNDYALVLRNGLVVQLALNLFVNKGAIMRDLEHMIGEYAKQSGESIELPQR